MEPLKTRQDVTPETLTSIQERGVLSWRKDHSENSRCNLQNRFRIEFGITIIKNFYDRLAAVRLPVFFVRPARTCSKGCKSLNRPDSGKVTAKGKGVRRETESEGSWRQTSGLTDRNPI